MKQAMVQLQPLSQLIDETVENELNRYSNDHDARNYVYDERGDFDPLKHGSTWHPLILESLALPVTSFQFRVHLRIT
jgi:hypothetical protein